eukprot:3533928-Rhodomonas_salina.2
MKVHEACGRERAADSCCRQWSVVTLSAATRKILSHVDHWSLEVLHHPDHAHDFGTGSRA